VSPSQSFIPLISEPCTSSGFRGSQSEPPRRWPILAPKKFKCEKDLNFDKYKSNTENSSQTNTFSRSISPDIICDKDLKPFKYGSKIINNDDSDDDVQALSSDKTDTVSTGSENQNDISYIADIVKIEKSTVQKVLNLIEDDCTVPFISRYRRTHINNIDTDKVNKINSLYSEIKAARERAKEVEMALQKQNRISHTLKLALKRCKNVLEVEQFYKLCCNESEESEKARNLGLGDSAYELLEGKRLDPAYFVNRFAVGLFCSLYFFSIN
jgi:hypothetical protein